MSLNVTLLSVSMGHGISKKSGTPKPYSFAFIEYLVPATNYIEGDHNIQKLGFEKKQIDMENNQSVFDKFKTIKPLTEVKLTLSADPNNPSRNVVTDVQKLAS